MASAVERSPTPFHRSQSSPDIFSLATLEKPVTAGGAATCLDDWARWTDPPPTFQVPSFNVDFELDTSVFAANGRDSPKPADSAEVKSPDHDVQQPLGRKPSRTTSLINRPRSWLSPGSSRTSREAPPEDRLSPNADNGVPLDGRDSSDRTLTVASPLASHSRWSWVSSRSSSHKAPPEAPATKPLTKSAPPRNAKPPVERLQLLTDADFNKRLAAQPASAVSRSGSYFSKKKPKPPALVTVINDGPDLDYSCASSAVSSGNRASNSDKTSGSQSTCSDGNTNTPITDESSPESSPPPLRDPLWATFRSLDAEIRGFSIKHTAQRVSHIKTVLVPFLRTAPDRASVRSLSIEDLDRRAVIFHKWWAAILDMLYDRAQHPVPGVDRPALLEAATLLMMRPEWRQATSYLQPLADRSPSERVRSRSWTTTSKSTDCSQRSMRLAESAEHNVRTLFVTNLVKQMGYVVDKMSVRHAPLSLVNFSGKTCAYAFFFAPGVADILVRLWGLTPELIRRAAEALGLPRRDGGESDDIVALFPPNLGPFGWTSARSMWDVLKQIPKMSLLVARIGWTGPWVSRWKGRDTDLFFIFCKYFHVLSDQFMPQGLPMTEKARSPAFVLVQAQLLSVLDTTIHRQMVIEHAYSPPLIDAVHGSDATAMSMPLPPTNLMKGMSENGMVMLLRDFLSEDAPQMMGPRHTFAEAFACLMKSATCRTSQFDSAACFTLCDLLDEVLTVYHDFESRDASPSYVDWEFWLDVCKRIMGSLNTMSEVRMLSFIYSIWDAATKDPRRKATLCLDWLLTEETFNSFFNNWCPMVRAYYQRLLCWRICRDDGNTGETDVKIMMTAAMRLRTAWSHYLYLRKAAEESGRAAPSTVPTCPALGKKFMIVRQEISSPQPGLFMGFDTFARTSCIDGLPGSGLADGQKGDSRKQWSLLSKVLSMTTKTTAAAFEGDAKSPTGDGDSLAPTRRGGMAEHPTRPAPLFGPCRGAKVSTARSTASEGDSVCSSPTYEEPKYSFKFILGWHQQPGSSAAGRELTRPRLPAPAQSQVMVRWRAGSMASSSSRPARRGPDAPRSEEEGPGAPEGRSSVKASVEEWLKGTSTTMTGDARWRASGASGSSGRVSPGEEAQTVLEPGRENLVKAVKPAGLFVRNSVYLGRALAEWSHVVSEHNSFVERRRDEGVERLGDVEVPLLGVEGFRKLGG
ncbi:hypothetical protein XA68_15521 [Ophiocordyceps unilateralis]|uniref:Uncharacterized protein n=1 Tax=Ophiocordyceps unilateralis TaxID=268505 RepID=A0A2A9P794_OPHUN|nr:hypothetical protein XA68_15521 [Ophiocordyceps unilateralis]